ncbi:acyl-CoA dehydrogenase family protein [Dechloromonas agitata]|uniref:acyl-CoA dehydrogenase family protein n=1 Tax=Dechloromonas agitata TaxID=73030 RepID=UPI00237E9AFD|nr:acyl-CoA dehydrogenase family protein [Dechloromonas agitata]MDE1544018.1 acyl-CoA dehydrogenase family protein [Dechloromonas agitata]
MDFRDAAEDAAFRETVRAWLESEVPRLGPAPDKLEERVEWWRPWQRRLHEAGYVGLAWPREYGGRGASVLQQAIFYEECDRAGAPDRLDVIGAGFAGPTLIEHGTTAQKTRFLDRILTGEELWCQLFSEPGAGSDLAALTTRATRDGDGWRIDGQKVWTSAAQVAEYAILLARTGEGERHRGISFFVLPMRQPGVDVRPLRQMLGGAEFNEVFLDGAHVPGDLLVGQLGGGWKVAMSTLGYERAAIATGRVNTLRLLDELIALVRDSRGADGLPLGRDAFVRQRLAELYTRMTLQRLTGKRILSTLAAGGAPGPEASTAKLFTTPLVEEICDFALSVIGIEGQEEPADTDPARAKWLRLAYQARGTSIAGGTSFIQRNILAERVLGMPRD